MPLHNNVKNM